MDPMKDPGATFYLEDTELKEAPKGGKYVGTAKLTASVHDIDLWEHAIEHLNGLVLHRGKDFKTELIGVLKDKNEELEQVVEKERTVLKDEIERMSAAVQHAEAASVKAAQRIRLLEVKATRLEQDNAALRERLDQWEGPGL